MPKRTNAKTLRRKPPVTKALLSYANDALALHNRLLSLAAKVEAVERSAIDHEPGNKRGQLKPRPCINCGGIYAPEQVGDWHCNAPACQEAKQRKLAENAARGWTHECTGDDCTLDNCGYRAGPNADMIAARGTFETLRA